MKKSNIPVTTDTQKQRFKTLKKRRKALLAYHGITHAQLARELGKSQWTVGTVVNLYPVKKSLPIQEHLAARLGVPYERLWGPRPAHTSTIAVKKRAGND
jgi:hypothetical protein